MYSNYNYTIRLNALLSMLVLYRLNGADTQLFTFLKIAIKE